MRVVGHYASMSIGFLVVLAVGCATTESSTAEEASRGSGRTSDGALLTLEGGGGGPVWEGWTPASENASRPAALSERLGAFDYWHVDDSDVVQGVWSKVFPVLQELRTDAGDRRSRESMSLMLAAMEPSGEAPSTRMDLTFLVGRRGDEPVEGVACRLFRELEGGGTPTLTVLLLRRSGRQKTPDEIYVWAAPGFEHPSTVTAKFSRSGDDWRRSLDEGLKLDQLGGEASDGERIRLAAEMLTESIWGRFSGNAYVSSQEGTGEGGADLPETVAEALGMEVHSRAVDQVYSDTEFPPRANASDF